MSPQQPCIVLVTRLMARFVCGYSLPHSVTNVGGRGHCILCIVHCILYTVHCTLYTIPYTVQPDKWHERNCFQKSVISLLFSAGLVQVPPKLQDTAHHDVYLDSANILLLILITKKDIQGGGHLLQYRQFTNCLATPPSPSLFFW